MKKAFCKRAGSAVVIAAVSFAKHIVQRVRFSTRVWQYPGKQPYLLGLVLFSSLYLGAQPAHVSIQTTVLHRIHAYLDKENKLQGFYAVTDSAFLMYASEAKKAKGEPEFTVYWTELGRFKADLNDLSASLNATNPSGIIYRWEPAHTPLTDTSIHPAFHPAGGLLLANIRIALDPGHTAETLESGKTEQKYIHILPDPANQTSEEITLVEGHLTLGTALTLKHQLEEAGATVLLTRQKPGETAFGTSFEDWCKNHLAHALDSLVACKSITSEQRVFYKTKADKRRIFRDIFRDIELQKRADVINAFHPDLTVIIHYNVDEKNTDWKKLSSKNYVMTFIGGAMLPSDLNKKTKRLEFLRMALTDDLNKSDLLSSEVVTSFSEVLQVPIASKNQAEYLEHNCMATSHAGVYCRNLILTRLIHGPLVYGESLYQDNMKESSSLQQEDKQIDGVGTSPRCRQVAAAYFKGILSYCIK